MILLDYSQICIANIMQFQKDLQKTGSSPEGVNLIRHAILSGIKMYRKQFRSYGDLVICCDGGNYWRKEIFPHYKACRKTMREASTLDWGLIFSTMDELREDLKEHFPYKVLRADRAEADDIIATMCLYTQTNALKDYGMFEEKQPVMIVSGDFDFKQLHKFDNVSQWSPIKKKKVTSEDPARDLITKVLTGDVGDGVPNICSRDDIFVTEGRQTPFRKNRIDDFIRLGRDACKDDIERHGWDRNVKMVDLTQIPDDIQKAIISQYEAYIVKGDKMKIFEYLVSKKCRLLLNDLDEF